jgi:hypothetical membrane protein
MRTLNKLLEILFRFVAPVGILLFSVGALVLVLSGIYPPSGADMTVHMAVIASFGIALSVAMIVLFNATRLRFMWRDWDRQWYGETPHSMGKRSTTVRAQKTSHD